MYEILGYADEWTVAPGETINFKVSCEEPMELNADLVRIRCGDNSPGAPGLKESLVISGIGRSIPGIKQFTEAGSRAIAEAFTESCSKQRSWLLAIMPTLPQADSEQTILSRHKGLDTCAGGYRLGIDKKGYLFFEITDKENKHRVTLNEPVIARQWYVVRVLIDEEAGLISLSQKPKNKLLSSGTQSEKEKGISTLINIDDTPLIFAAVPTGGGEPKYKDYYNGRIDSPTLLPYLASERDEWQLYLEASARRFKRPPLVSWDFSIGIDGDKIIDTVRHGAEGFIENLPARGVPGFRWDATVMSWQERPDHYAAIHFHDDNLEDANWQTTLSFVVPDNLESGLYAAKFYNDKGQTERITFIIRPKANAQKKKIAFLLSTATYMAYSNSHYRIDEEGMEMKAGNFMVLYPWDIYLGEHRELGLSMYDTHSDGYGVYYASRRRPVFSMHLECRTWSLNADTRIIDWLDEKGFEYDVISDDMLHQDGLNAIEDYNVIITGAHPEYWSTRMWEAMTAYQNQGGRLMYLGGNGFYWRCAFHPEKPWLMELRRTETGARYSETRPGESYHSYTGEYGGTWRRIGIPPQTLVGIGTTATGFDASSYYRRREDSYDPRAEFIFEGIGEEIIGDFGSSGGGAAGDELDRADFELGTPPHALILARSEKHTRYYNLVPEETLYHHPTINGQEAKHCYADMVFYECPNGGAVFSTGSITWAASLCWNNYDNNVSQITENVLRRFADDKPFDFPSVNDQ